MLVFRKQLEEITGIPCHPCRPLDLRNSISFLPPQLQRLPRFPAILCLRVPKCFFPGSPLFHHLLPLARSTNAQGHQTSRRKFSVMVTENAEEISIEVVRTVCLAVRQFRASFLWVIRLCITEDSMTKTGRFSVNSSFTGTATHASSSPEVSCD